jgi:hypothetical protein
MNNIYENNRIIIYPRLYPAAIYIKKSLYIRLFFNNIYYSCTGASTGHTLAHAPQSMQAAASISYLSSPEVIAPTGHSGSHAPQLMHASVILYDIYFHLPFILRNYSNTNLSYFKVFFKIILKYFLSTNCYMNN